MARYKVNHTYRSSAIGLDEGVVVDLDDDLAAWLEGDSPGVITLVDGGPAEPTPAEVDLGPLKVAELQALAAQVPDLDVDGLTKRELVEVLEQLVELDQAARAAQD